MLLTLAAHTLNYEILPSKLNHYCISGYAFDWLKSYLSGRTQCATIDNQISEIQTIKYGVPQDSILWPLLFKPINKKLKNTPLC